MKNVFILIFFFLLINCSNKKNLEFDIDDLKKDGKIILESKKANLEDDLLVNKIQKIKLYSTDLTENKKKFDLKFSILKSENFSEYMKNNYFKKYILNHDNKIIFIDDESNLFIIDTNFKVLSKFQIYKKKEYKKFILKFSLLVKNNILYVSTNLGKILAFDINKNSILWSNDLNVPFLSNIVSYKDSIFSTNANGKLYSFDMLSGKQNWSYETGTASIKSTNAFKINLKDNILIFSNDLGNIYFINLDSRNVLASYQVPQSTEMTQNNLFEITNFVLEDINLYFASSYGKIIKINIVNGTEVWTNELISNLKLIVNPETIISINERGFINIFDKKSGAILFKKNLIKIISNDKLKVKNSKLNNIFIFLNYILVTTNDGYLISINSANLNDINVKKISNEVKSNVILYNNNLFFIGEKNFIYRVL